jgi:hypothetical protein
MPIPVSSDIAEHCADCAGVSAKEITAAIGHGSEITLIRGIDQRDGRDRRDQTSAPRGVPARRCLVPVDNFYDGEKIGKERQPYAVALADHSIMALAGMWETWRSPAGELVRSFTIVTTEPNAS